MINNDRLRARIIKPMVEGSFKYRTFTKRKNAAMTTINVMKSRIEMLDIVVRFLKNVSEKVPQFNQINYSSKQMATEYIYIGTDILRFKEITLPDRRLL